ncbi:SelT/SelW/SelH family protein [Streptomyces phaeochromogenes]|uniref:SelT/SelW/SelH family protein n=1 Tax=Streptomyces phaeochromogenes TaxID=1923 RepID=UPI00224D6903|nr:SelT/SelW/SelH family protein [Streptomyces phaeochromogenes]MCX5600530.1 SelT/SelW/SelH family protein [Streptomyces phaeochromogenes]WTA03259.1 SelT/SelW/SelH family protein [Streptomyces phaeochromogenes]
MTSENVTTENVTPENTHRVQIEYCTQCRWLPRAAWLAQELLTTFEQELTELALKPGTGGVFVVRVDDEVVWDRREQGFPEPTAVKRLVRDRVAPEKSLGHSEK